MKNAANKTRRTHNKRFCINIIPQLVVFAIGTLAKRNNIRKFCKNEQYPGGKLVKTTK